MYCLIQHALPLITKLIITKVVITKVGTHALGHIHCVHKCMFIALHLYDTHNIYIYTYIYKVVTFTLIQNYIDNLDFSYTLIIGGMDMEVFAEWFKKFANTIKEHALFLMFDGYMRHISIPVIERALQDKGYLRYKTITPQNVLSEAQVKNFFIL